MRASSATAEWLYRLRLLWLGALVFAVFATVERAEFATTTNLGNIVRATTTDALPAVGFTLVMIVGQLDLSIGATMCMGGVTAICAQPVIGWWGAIGLVAVVGMLIGLANGLLVARGRVNSFIVTLGTMTVLTGVTRAILEGGSRSLASQAAGDWAVDLLNPVLPWSPRLLAVAIPIVLIEVALRRTRYGANLYLVGASPDAAWSAGVPVARVVTGAFVFSGALASLGGALTAIGQNTVMPNIGEKTLMLVVASVIAGGTAMSGGRGSVVMSVAALLLLNALTNGLSYLGADKSAKLVAQGAVLAAIIVYDAWRRAQQVRRRGQRRELLRELETHPPPIAVDDSGDEQGSDTMQTRQTDRTFAAVCVCAVACVAIVAIYAMWSRKAPAVEATAAVAPVAPAAVSAGGAASSAPAPDVASLKATDGQPLLYIDESPLNAPKRPADPTKLADDDPLRWYDNEYAGWSAQKLPQPASPGTGPQGKRVVSLQYMNHPYWQGYSNGLKRMAKLYGIDVSVMEASNDNKAQMDQVAQVIASRPDLVIITPVDSTGVVPMLKRLYEAGMPTIASNLLPIDEGMKYVICWTGPDDWGQFRMLAREFAKRMDNKGGYCVVRHLAGTSCYLSRTWAAVSELKKVAPEMRMLAMETTDLQAEKTKTQVAAWLKTFGPELKGIVSADDSKAQAGIAEALKDAGREDVICVAAGASQMGLTFIQQGQLHAITYQSAEGDGALPIEIAARWFRGEKIDRPIYYLRKHIITAEDVTQFLPPQW